jgi:hypothetical protein
MTGRWWSVGYHADRLLLLRLTWDGACAGRDPQIGLKTDSTGKLSYAPLRRIMLHAAQVLACGEDGQVLVT